MVQNNPSMRELRTIVENVGDEVFNNEKEKLLYPPTVFDGEMKRKPYKIYNDYMQTKKVGDIIRSHAAAPGYGYTDERITRMDDTGIYGVRLADTIQELEPWMVEGSDNIPEFIKVKLNGRVIGSVWQQGPGDWGAEVDVTGMSWDMIDTQEDAEELVRDEHLSEGKGSSNKNDKPYAGTGKEPYATMADSPDKYLFRKDGKQKLVGSKDNECDHDEEELEEENMNKELDRLKTLAGLNENQLRADLPIRIDQMLMDMGQMTYAFKDGGYRVIYDAEITPEKISALKEIYHEWKRNAGDDEGMEPIANKAIAILKGEMTEDNRGIDSPFTYSDPLGEDFNEGVKSRMADVLGRLGGVDFSDIIEKESQKVVDKILAMIPEGHPKAAAVSAAMSKIHEYLRTSSSMQEFEERGQKIGPMLQKIMAGQEAVDEDEDSLFTDEIRETDRANKDVDSFVGRRIRRSPFGGEHANKYGVVKRHERSVDKIGGGHIGRWTLAYDDGTEEIPGGPSSFEFIDEEYNDDFLLDSRFREDLLLAPQDRPGPEVDEDDMVYGDEDQLSARSDRDMSDYEPRGDDYVDNEKDQRGYMFPGTSGMKGMSEDPDRDQGALNDRYDDETLNCKYCGDYFCTSKFGGKCPKIQTDWLEEGPGGEDDLDDFGNFRGTYDSGEWDCPECGGPDGEHTLACPRAEVEESLPHPGHGDDIENEFAHDEDAMVDLGDDDNYYDDEFDASMLEDDNIPEFIHVKLNGKVIGTVWQVGPENWGAEVYITGMSWDMNDTQEDAEELVRSQHLGEGKEYSNNMYEMNRLRELAGIEPVVEKKADKDYDGDGKIESSEEEFKGSKDKAIKKDKMKEDQFDDNMEGLVSGKLIPYEIDDERAYYMMADILGAELDFGPEDEILVPAAREDEIVLGLEREGFVQGKDFWRADMQNEMDLQNGYNDRAFSKGDDYFPRGAQSTPASDLGPSASGMADNPMSNKMRMVKKDTVYETMKLAYRRFRRS